MHSKGKIAPHATLGNGKHSSSELNTFYKHAFALGLNQYHLRQMRKTGRNHQELPAWRANSVV